MKKSAEINPLVINTISGEELLLAAVVKSNRYIGEVILPYACRRTENGRLRAEWLLSAITLNENYGIDQQLILLHELTHSLDVHQLIGRFSKKKVVPPDFFGDGNRKILDQVVFPFIWRQISEIVRILQLLEIPVFEPRFFPHLYPENQITIESEIAQTKLYFHKGDQTTRYRLEAVIADQTLRLLDEKAIVLSNEPCFVLVNKRLIKFDRNVTGSQIKPFLSKEEIIIPARIEKEYFERFIKKIAGHSNIEASGFILEDIDKEPVAHLKPVMGWQGYYGFVLMFDYVVKIIPSDFPQQVMISLQTTESGFEFRRSKRNPEWEAGLMAILESLNLQRTASFYYRQVPDLQIYGLIEFLQENKSRLTDAGFVIDQPDDLMYIIDPPELKVSVRQENDWFDLKIIIQAGAFSFPFVTLRQHILDENREYVLPDGSRFVIPVSWFEKYSGLFIHGVVQKHTLRLKKHHKVLCDFSEFKLENQLNISTEASEFDLKPVLYSASLRPYQEFGFYWLTNHLKNQTGGILADDMGLGKTVQVIALLAAWVRFQQEKTGWATNSHADQPASDNGQLDLFSAANVPAAPTKELSPFIAPSLIVMPTSLIYNWKEEIRRFAPSLRVMDYSGPNRKISVRMLQQTDIVLTTYGVMRNDIEVLEKYPFSIIVLDESQQIKNASSKTAVSAYALNGKYKFVLTGTPVENHLADLWSQMHFVNPGLLGSLAVFNKHYGNPVSKNPESPQREKLLILTNSFILRRTKSQVAPELPGLTETIVYCEMTDEQRHLYESEKSKMRNALIGQVNETATAKDTAVLYLTALMKLRQVANHPRLLFENHDAESGKYEEVINHLETILEEDHKVLIFSSFVTQLELLESMLQDRAIGYQKLTGSTSNRSEVIKRFKTESKEKVFLISLKAGGVGLNLAEADYVFILDPWWNPAAESQAISRSHRIGQKSCVFVYRFITKGTIEEKIMVLQESKRILAKSTIVEESFYATLTRDEMLELVK